VWRKTLQDVGDKYGLATLTYRAQHFVQHLARTANEWLTAAIFFRAWRLTNDHPVSASIAYAKDSLCTARGKFAASALGNTSLQLVPIQIPGIRIVNMSNRRRIRLCSVARQPDINAHGLQVGAPLLFGLIHRYGMLENIRVLFCHGKVCISRTALIRTTILGCGHFQ
jgi:hypothetical protein